MKPKWEKPELIILYRGRSDESVLTHCKHKDEQIDGPEQAAHDNCNDSVTSCGACVSNANRS